MYWQISMQYRKGNQDRHVQALVERDHPIQAIELALATLKKAKGKDGKVYAAKEAEKTTVLITKDGEVSWLMAPEAKDPKQKELKLNDRDPLDRGARRALSGPGAPPPLMKGSRELARTKKTGAKPAKKR